MKKKLFFALMLSVVMAGAWFVVENQTQPKLSDVALANIEALASGEETHGQATCYSNIAVSSKVRVLSCVTCEYVYGIGLDEHGGGTCFW